MPPEIIKKEKYDQKVDIWSAGVIVYFLLHGQQPFKGSNQVQLYHNIINEELKIDPDDWEEISEDAKDFVIRCLNKDPKKRPSAAELLRHPWLNNR